MKTGCPGRPECQVCQLEHEQDMRNAVELSKATQLEQADEVRIKKEKQK
jgi:hypothetical protein